MLTLDLLRAHEGQRLGEAEHGWNGISVDVVLVLCCCPRLWCVGSGCLGHSTHEPRVHRMEACEREHPGRLVIRHRAGEEVSD